MARRNSGLHAVVSSARRRIDHGEIYAEVVQALVHEQRHHGGRAVEGVLARRGQERLCRPTPRPSATVILERVGHALVQATGPTADSAAEAPENSSPPITGPYSKQWPSASMTGG